MIGNDHIRYIGKDGGWVKIVKLFFTTPGYKYTLIMRLGQSEVLVFRYFFRFILRFLSRYYGFQIPASAKIGHGLFLGHFGTIVINKEALIGKNCNIAQGVTIGQSNRGKRKGAPNIGDEVWIGPNSVVVGSVNIGNNVLIGPNSFVNIDVPPNSIVIGNPCIVTSNELATEGYINNKV
ncbi:serine O-acetyltransferase [Algoriphagus winogradskyi]|uniref:Serine acetyltransferase n=1 Tax=Algoriphagus winogradskyi TaxID=237017 RepID=A0ABY1PGT5_9BACT|nr:serine acetyltransferase [Algoriphagus winogradskyi]SMP33406.1 serine O-acetyltransferase [Algoriphagus winogradskyi]